MDQYCAYECVADLQQERVALRNAVDFILSGY